MEEKGNAIPFYEVESPFSSPNTNLIGNEPKEKEKFPLSRFTNHFQDAKVEKSYQLYTAVCNLSRAQHIIMMFILSHIAFCITQIMLNRREIYLLPSMLKTKTTFIQLSYLLIAVPFAFFPFNWLDRRGTMRLGVYILKKRWKRWAAIIIVWQAIGMQLWACISSAYSVRNFKAKILPKLECMSSITLPLSKNISAVEYVQTRNRYIFIEFTALFAVLISVMSATVAVSLQLDFTHVAFTTTITCITLWLIILTSKHDVEGTPHFITYILILIPTLLIWCSTYSSDRNSRKAYLRKLQIERENTSLKSGLQEAQTALSNLSATDEELSLISSVFIETSTTINLKLVAIPYSDLTLKSIYAASTTYEIILADYLGTTVTLKRLKRDLLSFENVESFRMQIELLAYLRHPNIVQFLGASWDSCSNLCIVMEYMEKGNVYSLLHSDVQLSWIDPLFKIAIDAAQGIAYLHNLNPSVIHRDLKSSNLLCSATFGCKVADFAESIREKIENSLETFVGTPYWLAPEIIRQEKYGTKTDCYSFGIILIELESRKDPYYDLLDRNTLSIMLGVANQGLRPTIPPCCTTERTLLIEDCLKDRPQDRPSIAEILIRLQKDFSNELLNCAGGAIVKKRKMLRRQSCMKGQSLALVLQEQKEQQEQQDQISISSNLDTEKEFSPSKRYQLLTDL